MSSFSQLLRDRRRALLAALTVAACLLQWLGAMSASAVELTVVTVVPPSADQQVTVVADVRPATARPLRSQAFSVAAGTTTLPTTAVPVVSDRLAVGLVVDGSADGASAMHQGLSGAANFLLQMPVAARVAAVADTSPPTILARLRPGAKDTLRALDRLRPAGARSTSEALSLALRQLPDAVQEPRIVLLLTGAADAGGEDPVALAERLRQAHALLAVVSTGADTSYWARVAADTGGVLVAPQSADLLTAFETLAGTLRTRYLLTFPAPAQLPGWVSVRVRTAAGTLSADAYVDGGSAPAAPASGGGSLLRILAIGLAVAVVPILAALLLRARSGPRSDGEARVAKRAPPPARRVRVEPAAEAPPMAPAGELADIERPRLPSRGPWPPPAVPRPATAETAGPRAAGTAETAGPPAAEGGAPSRPERAQPRAAGTAETAGPPAAENGDGAPASLERTEPPAAGAADMTESPAADGAENGAAPSPESAKPSSAGTTGPAEPATAGAADTAEVWAAETVEDGAPSGPRNADRSTAESVQSVEADASARSRNGDPSRAESVQSAEPGASSSPEISEPAAAAGAGVLPAGVSPAEDERAYAHLDAHAANAAAAVKTGRLDRRRAVARIALAAPGRIDLLDRLIDAERRMAGSRLATWSGTDPVLGLLAAARRVVTGDLTLTGPGGVRVEQTAPPGADPISRTVLRLTRNGRWVRDCHTAEELARHVDLATLRANLDPEPDRPADSAS
jgi:hypothetical protein